MTGDQWEIEDIYRTTPAQTSMLTQRLVDPAGFRHQLVLQVRRELDGDAFASAWRHVADRHAILRTRFAWEGLPHPVQVVHRGAHVAFTRLDWRDLPEPARAERLEELLASEQAQALDLTAGPPSRVTLARTGARSHLLVWSTHPLLYDDWSLPVLLDEVFASHDALRAGGRPAMLPEPAPLRDYVAWLDGRDGDADRAYWRERLDGFERPTPLLAAGWPVEDGGEAQAALTLPGELARAVRQLAGEHLVTDATVLHAAWALLLARRGGSPEVLFGSTLKGRSARVAGVERMVGPLASTLPLRLRVDPDEPVGDWLRSVDAQVRALREHEHCALADVQRCAAVAADLPLFDTVMAVDLERDDLPLPPGVSLLRRAGAGAGHPLVLRATTCGQIRLECRYERTLIAADEVERLLARYAELPRELRGATRVGDVAVDLAVQPRATAASSGAGATAGTLDATAAALVEIWKRVLALDAVGPRDNFFELGGDSILSMQVVAQAREAGLPVTPRLVFEHRTIAELAAAVDGERRGGRAATPDQEAETGEVPLTPIQRWFTELDWPHDHYARSVRLEWAGAVDPELLAGALRGLLRQHPALRLRLALDGSGWRQHVADDDERSELVRLVDLSGLPDGERDTAMAAAATRAHAGMDLANGPIVRAVLFCLGAGRPDQVVVSVHHLACDTVSWHVLLEDLATAYQQLDSGQPVRLPAATTPFRRWARRLEELAASDQLAAEADFWLEQAPAVPLPVDRPGGANTVERMVSLVTELPAGTTRRLLREAPAAYRTRINDLLLTALARAISRWTGSATVSVALEGHGREPLSDDLDLSRTVGWFTSLYPLNLALPDGGDPGSCLKAVKEQLRRVPANGVGYGLLRYLRPDSAAALAGRATPQLSFNYHGQLDPRERDAAGAAQQFTRLGAVGEELAPAGARPHLLEVGAAVVDGRLRIGWEYSADLHDAATVEGLAGDFMASLEELVAHCTSGAAGATPSDFPLAALDQETLDRLLGPFDPRQVDDVHPLSPLQAGMLFHSLYSPDGGDYFLQSAYALEGDLDADALVRAWQHVVDRHPSLRATFAWEGMPEPLQVVHAHAPVTVRRLDWTGVPAREVPERLAALLASERARGFDLERTPPQRFDLIRTGPRSHQLVWHNHHILLDGWSVPLVLEEVFTTYATLLAHGDVPALPAPVPYQRYIGWLQEQDREAALVWWGQALKGLTAPTPIAIVAEGGDAAAGVAVTALAPPDDLGRRLRQLARGLRITLNDLLQGAWALLLGRYSGERDVLYGTTVAGRSIDVPGIERMVGLLANTLPTRVRLDHGARVGEWLRGLHDHLGELRDYGHCSLVDIHHRSDIPGNQRLFDSIFVSVLEHVDESPTAPGGLQVAVSQDYERTGYPLVLAATVGERSRLHLSLSFDPGRVAGEDAERMLDHYRHLLEELTARPDALLGELAPMPPAAAEVVLRQWNDTRAAYPPEETVVDMIGERVRANPGAVAVVCGGASLTYAQLWTAAGRLARRLRREGVRPRQLVGVHLDRSAEMLVAVLGILRAGAAYLPLDPGYPRERLAFILRDAGAVLVLCGREHADLAGDGVRALPVGAVGEGGGPDPAPAPAAAPGPGDLAYTIYTSGSTGRPKGVEIEHRSLANLLLGMRDRLGGAAGDVWLALTSLSFDISALELFLPLIVGGRVVVATESSAVDGAALVELIRRQRVTHVQATPSGWQSLLAAGFDEPSLVALAGGEALPPRQARDLAGRACRLVNVYGPTETTVWSSAADIRAAAPLVTVGRPIANTRIYVLDERLQAVPVGVPGELCIGGSGLARGYRGRPALTAERFVPDRYGPPGARLYRTGDRARFRPDGQIEVLGRLDNQVKIRGHRIEPGEIETRLLEHPAVDQAAVVAEASGGGPRLVAFFVPRAAAPSPASLRQHLAERVPRYMVPSDFVALERLPLTPNRKLDRKALVLLRHARPDSDAEYVAPRTATEKVLADIWAEVLERDRVGAHSRFFDSGGDSLRSIQVMVKARQAGLAVTPRQVFDHDTLAELAEAIDRGAAGPAGAAPWQGADRSGSLVERLHPGAPVLVEAMARHRVRGVGVALISRHRLAAAWGEGARDGSDGAAPVGAGTAFQVGSVSKHVTALGVLRLAQEGRVDLDEDVGRYLRSWRLPAGPQGGRVTLRHLLAHTAGLNVTICHGYRPDGPVPTLLDVLEGRPPADNPPVRAERAPGANRYSSSHYVVIQQVVEDVTGIPFAQWMRSTVLEPLGMKDSGFEPCFPEDPSRAPALGHHADGTRYDTGWLRVPELAAAGLWATPADLARVALEIQRAVAGTPTRFLGQELATAMLTPSPGSRYGLGTVIRRVGGARWFGHPGDVAGHWCFSATDPERGVGLVVAANSDAGEAFLQDLLGTLEFGLDAAG